MNSTNRAASWRARSRLAASGAFLPPLRRRGTSWWDAKEIEPRHLPPDRNSVPSCGSSNGADLKRPNTDLLLRPRHRIHPFGSYALRHGSEPYELHARFKMQGRRVTLALEIDTASPQRPRGALARPRSSAC